MQRVKLNKFSLGFLPWELQSEFYFIISKFKILFILKVEIIWSKILYMSTLVM